MQVLFSFFVVWFHCLWLGGKQWEIREVHVSDLVDSDELSDSVLSLIWATGSRRDETTFKMLHDAVKHPFMDGYELLFLDDDIGVFHESRIKVGRRVMPVPFNEVCDVMRSRALFMDADKNNVSIDAIMSSDVIRGFIGLNDYVDVTRSIGYYSSGVDLNLGAAVRFAELLSSGVYKAGLLGQDSARILTSLPVFNESLIELVLYPEEFALQALLARL